MRDNDQSAIPNPQSEILKEYVRREAEVSADLYAPWNAAEQFAVAERKLTAAELLQRAGRFPEAGDAALEIGYGKLGWLADLISWGLRAEDLHGMELDPRRAAVAQAALPSADLRVGDASSLPWRDGSFKLIVVSTVFSSIPASEMQRRIAYEIGRVLHPEGALVWYDLAVDNPKNPNVRGIGRRALDGLFPEMTGEVRSVTLAPPLARMITPRSFAIAAMLRGLPFLRTHLLGVLRGGDK